MDKIGLKLFKPLDYDTFEPLQYWLDYDFEYDDLIEVIENDTVIELDLEEDEDREEDIQMLQTFLRHFEEDKIAFKLFNLSNNLEQVELEELA
jgi:hypothetical protein